MAEKDLNAANVVDEGFTEEDHDPHYEPIISLPEVATSTNEEDEVELIKLRAKLFRYDSGEDPPEWKERGTGDVKLLQHRTKNTVRVVMRRDKTLKICANHFVTPNMELKPNCGSDRAWVWSTLADFTTEVMQPELLAIRFASADNAKKWKDMFEEAKSIVATQCDLYKDDPEESKEDDTSSEGEGLGESLGNLKIHDGQTDVLSEKVDTSHNKDNSQLDESPEK